MLAAVRALARRGPRRPRRPSFFSCEQLVGACWIAAIASLSSRDRHDDVLALHLGLGRRRRARCSGSCPRLCAIWSSPPAEPARACAGACRRARAHRGRAGEPEPAPEPIAAEPDPSRSRPCARARAHVASPIPSPSPPSPPSTSPRYRRAGVAPSSCRPTHRAPEPEQAASSRYACRDPPAAHATVFSADSRRWRSRCTRRSPGAATRRSAAARAPAPTHRPAASPAAACATPPTSSPRSSDRRGIAVQPDRPLPRPRRRADPVRQPDPVDALARDPRPPGGRQDPDLLRPAAETLTKTAGPFTKCRTSLGDRLMAGRKTLTLAI